MKVTIKRYVNTYSRNFSKQEVTFDSNDVEEVTMAAESPWINEPLVLVKFTNHPSITVSRKDFFDTVKALEDHK